MYNNERKEYDYITKVVIVGESNVGKTNILSRYCKDEFNFGIKPTLGVEFFNKIVNVQDKVLKLQLWDTAGQEKYKAVTNSFYKNSSGALVIFDLTVKKSFELVDNWIKDLKESAGDKVFIVLLGNKLDLEDKREITEEQGLNKAKEYSR